MVLIVFLFALSAFTAWASYEIGYLHGYETQKKMSDEHIEAMRALQVRFQADISSAMQKNGLNPIVTFPNRGRN